MEDKETKAVLLIYSFCMKLANLGSGDSSVVRAPDS